MTHFDSDVHALIAGGLSAVLDFPNFDGLLSFGRKVQVTIGADDEGKPTHVFLLRIEQEKP